MWTAAAAWLAGRLHVYLGAVPCVGKTYAMLAEGQRLAGLGADVVVTLVETHGRSAGPGRGWAGDRPEAEHRLPGTSFGGLDVDALLARRPAVALADELAHCKRARQPSRQRWQDVDELLRAGIDVMTTLNVQHLAGMHDAVERITGVLACEAAMVVAVRRPIEREDAAWLVPATWPQTRTDRYGATPTGEVHVGVPLGAREAGRGWDHRSAVWIG